MKNSLLILALLFAACTQNASNKPSRPIEETTPAKNDVMCTQDAKQCADGTWVGRTPPTCAFICPNGDDATR